jgi:hypothetical protein
VRQADLHRVPDLRDTVAAACKPVFLSAYYGSSVLTVLNF